jgi:hypothetical protein
MTPRPAGATPDHGQILTRDVLPFALALAALAAAALLLDAALHLFHVVWIGRYLGIPGLLLILASLGYSLRKRGLIRAGSPVMLLGLHEKMAWAGSLMVLVHAGIHFNALLAWLAVGAMLINVGSGLTGKYLLKSARRRLDAERSELRQEGLTPEAVASRLHWDAFTVDIVRRWRVVHIPIALAFAVLAAAHVAAVFWYWSWR